MALITGEGPDRLVSVYFFKERKCTVETFGVGIYICNTSWHDKMVGEERPKKVQKLSHDANGDEQSMMQTLPSLQLSSNGQIAMPDKDASEPVQDAAADSADDQILQSQSLGGSGSGPPDFPLNSSCA